MDLATLGWLLAGLGVALLWVTLYLTLQFLVTQAIASKGSNSEYVMQQILRTTANDLLRSLVATSASVITTLIVATLRLIATLYRRRFGFAFSILIFIGLLTLYFMQVPATETLIIGYQNVAVPVLHKFIYPLLNVVSMLASIVIAGLNWLVQIMIFFTFGIAKIMIGCLLNQDIYTLFVSLMEAIRATTADLIAWIVANPFIARYDTTGTTAAIGALLSQTTGVGNCTCAAVFFIYEDGVILVNSPEFIVTIDATVNSVLTLLQRFTPLPVLFGQPAFTLGPFATEAPVAMNGAGNVLILAIKLLLNSIYGFFDTQNQLPQDVQDFLSQPLLEPITQLASGSVIFTNITLEAVKNPYNVYSGPTTGLPYFQFGKVIDRIRQAVRAFGSYFILLGPNVVDAITKTLLIPVELTGFVAEFIPALIYYIFYPPIQNPLQYLLVYYQIPGNGLLRTFIQAYLAADELGLVVSLLNKPLGDATTSALGSIIAFIQIVTEIIFYSYNLFGFQNTTPTYTDIDTITFFANLVLFNEALGDNVRQFDPDFCFDPLSGNYTQDTTICAYAIAQTATIDVLISFTLEIATFLQTFLASLRLPSPDFSGVAIPRFDTAIDNAEDAGCALSRAILLLIPLDGTCQFNNAEAAALCGSGQLCAAYTLCEVWETALSLLRIANDFFIKLSEGGRYETYTAFFSAAIRKFISDAGQAVRGLAALLDCLICRVVNPGGTNCSTPIYDLFDLLVKAVDGIIEFVTDIFMDVFLLIAGLIKNLFVDGNIIKSLIDFAIGVFDLIIKAGSGLVQFVIKWLDDAGLGAIASVIRVFDLVFCNVVKGIIAVINLIAGSAIIQEPQCSSLSDLKRAFSTEEATVKPDATHIMDLFPTLEEIPSAASWKTSSGCGQVIGDLATRTLDEVDMPELVENSIYCMALLYWDDYLDTAKHRKIVFENTCGYMMIQLHKDQPEWSSLSYGDRALVRTCIQGRYFMDFIRNRFNATYLPRDLRTNAWRAPVYASEILMDLTRAYHHYSDQHSLPGQVRQQNYIDSLTRIGANVTYITANMGMSDAQFGVYLDTLDLKDYLEMNSALHPDEVILIDEFGRAIFSGGVNLVTELLSTGTGELEVSFGTTVLSDSTTTSRSLVALFSDILYKTYKVVTVGSDILIGTPQKRAIMGNGAIIFAEGMGHLMTGVSNVTTFAIEYYGSYRDRTARIAAGTATTDDLETHHETKVWWEETKDKTLPTRWEIYAKPDILRARQRARLWETSRPNDTITCAVAERAHQFDTKRGSGRRLHPRQKSIRRHIDIVRDSIERLRTPTKEAQDRYDSVTNLFSTAMDYFYQGYSDGVQIADGTCDLHFRTPMPSEYSLESVHGTTVATQSFQSIFIGPPVCLSNYTTVCEKCLAMDNLIATVLHASGNLVAFVNGVFQTHMQARRDFLQYTYDDNAIVRVGQRPGLPVWFPLPNVSAYTYIGPPENVTTIGFTDYDAVTGLIPTVSGIISDNITPGSIYYAVFTTVNNYAPYVVSRIETLATWISSGTEDGTTEEVSLIGKIVDDVFVCDFTIELDGTQRRFSVPIAIFWTVAIFFFARVAFSGIFGAEGILSNILPSSMLAMYAFLYLSSNWSIGCTMAYPLHLPHDIIESVTFTFFPKCLYYISGMLEHGHYHFAEYCSSIDLVETVRAYSCRVDGQFYDIFAHLAFTVVNYWPSGVSYLESIPYVRGYVATYQAVDMTDPVLYSFVFTCNAWFGLLNFGLVVSGIFSLFFLREFIFALLQLIAIPITLIADIYNTAFLALSETDYLLSIVSDRERLNDRELMRRDTNATNGTTLVDPDDDDDDDGFSMLNTRIPMPASALINDDDDDDDDDPTETTSMLNFQPNARRRNRRARHGPFGIIRPQTPTSKYDTTFDRL